MWTARSDNCPESGSATLSAGYRNALAGARFSREDLRLRAEIFVSENLFRLAREKQFLSRWRRAYHANREMVDLPLGAADIVTGVGDGAADFGDRRAGESGRWRPGNLRRGQRFLSAPRRRFGHVRRSLRDDAGACGARSRFGSAGCNQIA